jgi:hypothetical protein
MPLKVGGKLIQSVCQGKTYNSARSSNHQRWLYSLNLTIDANFRLKNKARGIEDDPPLGDGWGHWVPNEPYQAYIKDYGNQKEVCLRVFLENRWLLIH